MTSVEAINNMKNKRLTLIRELEMLTKTRAQRGTYISRDMNKRIYKLEEQILKLTHDHRQQIKNFYSGRTS